MTSHKPTAAAQLNRRPQTRAWLIYALFGLVLLAVLTWTTISMVREAPTREAVADLGPHGLVTIRLSTNPHPPLPEGQVTLNFEPMDARQRTVTLDRISYEYGPAGSSQPAGFGEAQFMAGGDGLFMANARFPNAGNWWLRARVQKGAAQADVRFSVYVKAAP